VASLCPSERAWAGGGVGRGRGVGGGGCTL